MVGVRVSGLNPEALNPRPRSSSRTLKLDAQNYQSLESRV